MKIALTRMNTAWENLERNKKTAGMLIEEASNQRADMIVFPEMTLTGFSMDISKISDNRKNTLSFFASFAGKYDIGIGFGYVTKPDEKGRNHFAVVDKSGNLLMDYIKIHPFTYSGEDKYYTGGGETGTFSFMGQWQCAGFVCYDLRFPESFQKLPDTDVIFVIANWPAERIRQWECLLRARAIEMQSYVVGVNRTGEGNGLSYPESSAAYSPQGDKMEMEIPTGGENLYVELDLEMRRNYVQHFPVRRDRRRGIDFV